MTRVTTGALVMRDRCPALTSVMWAPARWAMNVSSAGGMTWSAVPITAQDGMVFQAVIGTADRVIPPAELTFMAQRAGAHITDVKAGHLSLITKAPVVTRVILQAVQATG